MTAPLAPPDSSFHAWRSVNSTDIDQAISHCVTSFRPFAWLDFVEFVQLLMHFHGIICINL